MLLTKKVKVKWFYKTREHYENLGYIFTKWNDEFEATVDDLSEGSHIKVDVLCDYCEKTITSKSYKTYISQNKKSEIHLDCCEKCQPLKNKDVVKKKLKSNMLLPGAPGYWSIRENRLKHLKEYIDKYKTLDDITACKEGNHIYRQFIKYKDSIDEAIIEIGYDLSKVRTKWKIGHFDNFENLRFELNKFIDKNNHFPTVQEIINDLRISFAIIQKHGGIYEVKRKMNYHNDNDLIDDRGWYNKSTYEYIVAQFLIHNKIPYKREQYPFEELNLRSDFSFYTESKAVIHCEIWGYSKESSGNLVQEYNEKRKYKEFLYKTKGIQLINIDGDVFNNTYEKIQEKLKDMFEKILNIKLTFVKQEVIIPPSKMTDDEICEELISYTTSKKEFPSRTLMNKVKRGSLYNEIMMRYGSYVKFKQLFEYKLSLNNQSAS